MLSGCIMCSTLACVMLSCFWLSEALSSPMRPWRRWCRKFGQSFANCLRRRRPRPGDKWYLDEVFIRIQGVQHYLWRAVDQNGVVLDILVQGRRDATAATRFFRRLLAGLQYVPRVIVTDKLRSYGARGYSHPRRLSSSQPRITTWT
jgi:transposase-like protein